jgi:hypothetical protein
MTSTANNKRTDDATGASSKAAGVQTSLFPLTGEGKSIAEARQELKRTMGPGKSWADIEEDADKATSLFKELLDSSEFKQIFTALNSTLPEVRQGGMKSLITYMVKTTQLSKNDVKAVAKSLSPQALVLRSAPQAKAKQRTPKAPQKASSKNANQRRVEAELRALYPDYKTSGVESEYAKIKKYITDIHKQGKTIQVSLVRGLDAVKALPTVNLA